MRRVNDGRLSEHGMRTVSLMRADTSSSEVAVGSCATVARESGQVRKEAAFIGRSSVPQIAWPSLQSAK